MVKELYRKIVPRSLRGVLAYVRSKEYRRIRERRKRFGMANPDKVFYVIRMQVDNWGLFTFVFAVLEHIRYALEKGYIPVVDTKNYTVGMIQDKNHYGKENAWEYYYRPIVDGTSLEEVYQSRYVVLGAMSFALEKAVDWNSVLSEDVVRQYHVLTRDYLRLNDELASRVETARAELFPPDGKVLGVSVRRGYARGQLCREELFNGHPEQAGLEEYISDIDTLMELWDCKYLFLSVDDREASDYFVSRYGSKCIRLSRPLRHFFIGGKPFHPGQDNPEDISCEYKLDSEGNILNVEETTKEYMTEVYLLAQCDCLLASISSSSQMARILNGNKYEHVKMYDKGKIKIKED